MNRNVEALQAVQQPLQAVGKADGAGGVGHEEGSHDEEHDPQDHKGGVSQARVRDLKGPPGPELGGPGREKQVQDAGEDDDKQHRLQALHQGFEPHPGDTDTDRQHQGHQAVGQEALGGEQGGNIQHHQQDLCPGVQLVGHGISREILAQGDVLQHGAPPPFKARSWRSKSSTV